MWTVYDMNEGECTLKTKIRSHDHSSTDRSTEKNLRIHIPSDLSRSYIYKRTAYNTPPAHTISRISTT